MLECPGSAVYAPGMNRRFVNPALVCVLLWAVVAAGGCEFKGRGGGLGGEAGWRPEPEAMRIYPGGRFVQEQDRALLELRVELADAMGDPTKASGLYRFELFESASVQPLGARDTVWELPIQAKEDHEAHYDPVTRTYFFRLALDDAEPPTSTRLVRVTFMPTEDTRRLQAEAHVAGVAGAG